MKIRNYSAWFPFATKTVCHEGFKKTIVTIQVFSFNLFRLAVNDKAKK